MCGIAGILLQRARPARRVAREDVRGDAPPRRRLHRLRAVRRADESRLIVRARHPRRVARADRRRERARRRARARRRPARRDHDRRRGRAPSDRFLRFELRYTGDIKRLALRDRGGRAAASRSSPSATRSRSSRTLGGADRGRRAPPHLEVPRQPRPRPRAPRDRVDHRRRLRPPVLGRAVPRRLDRPQRADHELLHAPPPADRPRVPVPDRQRLRADRGLPGRQDVARARRSTRRSRTPSTSSTAASRTCSRCPT